MLAGAYFTETVTTPTQPHPLLVLNDLTKEVRFSWGSQKTCSPIQAFNVWSILDMEPELGYLSMPPLEESVAAHLCPSLTTEKPQLPSKPCKLMASLGMTSGLFGPVVDLITHKFERQQKESVVLQNLMPHRACSPRREPRQEPSPS